MDTTSRKPTEVLFVGGVWDRERKGLAVADHGVCVIRVPVNLDSLRCGEEPPKCNWTESYTVYGLGHGAAVAVCETGFDTVAGLESLFKAYENTGQTT